MLDVSSYLVLSLFRFIRPQLVFYASEKRSFKFLQEILDFTKCALRRGGGIKYPNANFFGTAQLDLFIFNLLVVASEGQQEGSTCLCLLACCLLPAAKRKTKNIAFQLRANLSSNSVVTSFAASHIAHTDKNNIFFVSQ